MSTTDPLTAVTAIVDELGDTDVDIVDTTALYERLRAALNVPTPTAADQTPATDSERVEQTRARLARIADWETTLNGHSLGRAYEYDVRHLLALLAEQAATIERVRVLHHPEPVFAFDAECGHDDEEHVTFEGRDGGTLCQDTPTGHACTDCRDELGDPVDWPCLTVRALGSQRTEGQG